MNIRTVVPGSIPAIASWDFSFTAECCYFTHMLPGEEKQIKAVTMNKFAYTTNRLGQQEKVPQYNYRNRKIADKELLKNAKIKY